MATYVDSVFLGEGTFGRVTKVIRKPDGKVPIVFFALRFRVLCSIETDTDWWGSSAGPGL
jgi:hypothetical protein